MARFLGIDSSTQSVTGIVIDSEARKIVAELSVSFKNEPSLAKYNCASGYLEHADDKVRHADPLMWVEALELLLEQGARQGLWKGVRGVSGSGQQHGSVYLNSRYEESLIGSAKGAAGWSPAESLADQVRPLLSRPTAPIWMDSSTQAQCREITRAAGSVSEVVRITGSRATERFTGPQIRKFHQTEPERYAQTARIHLVSSFMAWLMTARDAPIDRGDGAGMNLMDIETGDWSDAMLVATAPDLEQRLPACRSSRHVIGAVAPYFVQKYGFAEDCRVVAFSGDNCNSLVGMGAAAPGVAVISLGTSDTYFAAMARPLPDPNRCGHVFGDSLDSFMSLICFKNGSLARERVAQRVGLAKPLAGKTDENGDSLWQYDWERFGEAILKDTRPGNGGKAMLPYFDPEITPRILAPEVKLFGGLELAPHDAAAACRAVVESQALLMRAYSDWIPRPQRVLITGGGSRNEGVAQVFADVFGTEIHDLEVPKSAALGAAIRAAVGLNMLDPKAATDFSPGGGKVYRPERSAEDVYREMAKTLKAASAELIAKEEDGA